MGGIAKIIRKAVNVIAPKPKVQAAVQKVQTQASSVKAAAVKKATGAGGSLYGTSMNMTGAEGVEEEAQTAKTALGGGLDNPNKKEKNNQMASANTKTALGAG